MQQLRAALIADVRRETCAKYVSCGGLHSLGELVEILVEVIIIRTNKRSDVVF
jgi:hypothetical protein